MEGQAIIFKPFDASQSGEAETPAGNRKLYK